MKPETWDICKFNVKLSFRYLPRMFLAPVVGAFRGACEIWDKFDAEFDAYIAQVRARSSERVNDPPHATPKRA